MRQRIVQILANRWFIFGLALTIRWGVVAYNYFIYKTPGGVAPSPHGNEVYDLLGQSLLNGQGFSLWHFAYRPPLYPLFIALTHGLFNTANPLAAVFLQSIVSAAICPLAFTLAKELEAPASVQWLAALFIALDPASISINVLLMAETLANLFIAVTLIFLARLLRQFQWRDVAACAAATALAALARPNAIYFFAVVVIISVVRAPRMAVRAAAFAALFAMCVAPWYVRNYAYAGVATFATTSDFNLLFYKGVSVEQWATGKSAGAIQAEFTDELEKRLGIQRTPESYDENSFWMYLVPADTRAYKVMRDMAVEVYLAHPVIYLFLLPVTLVKLLGFGDVPNLLDPATVVSWIYNLGLYGCATFGSLLAFKNKAWLWLSVTLIPILYFLLVPAVTGGVQDTRARTNITICLALLAASGVEWLKTWRPAFLKSYAPNHLS
jgi:hypothetical protein